MQEIRATSKAVGSKGLLLPWVSFLADTCPHLQSYSYLRLPGEFFISVARLCPSQIAPYCGAIWYSIGLFGLSRTRFPPPFILRISLFSRHGFPPSRMEISEFDGNQRGSKGTGIPISFSYSPRRRTTSHITNFIFSRVVLCSVIEDMQEITGSIW
jgi:hypothetical protein